MLNARRHRSGGHNDPLQGFAPTPGVLNARRHRSGGHQSAYQQAVAGIRCSTPEGIGAAVTVKALSPKAAPYACSTPEGIGAAVTKQRRQRPEYRCVLNARRHRSGGQIRECSDLHRHYNAVTVLNARRHRSGEISRPAEHALRDWSSGGAQRPKASERRDHSHVRCGSAGRTRISCAQRPKASERRDLAPCFLSQKCRRQILGCSTPEGIGAARSLPGRWRRVLAGLCGGGAQRPKASERRDHALAIAALKRMDQVMTCSTPEGIGAARSSTPVREDE